LQEHWAKLGEPSKTERKEETKNKTEPKLSQVSRRDFLKKAAPVVAGVGLAGVLGTSRVFGSTSTPPQSPGRRIETASYVIYHENEFYAQNGSTGAIDFSGPDAAIVIQEAMMALKDGGKLFLKNGTYVVNSTVRVPSNTAIEGEGWGTIVRVGDFANTEAFKSLEGSSGIIFKNFKIDGNKANQTSLTGAMINLSESADGLLENVMIDSSADSGIWIASTTDVLVINCRVSNCNSAGVGIRGPLTARVAVIGGYYVGNVVGIQVINDCQFVTVVGVIAENNSVPGQYGSGIEWTALVGFTPPMFGSVSGCVCAGNDRGINLESNTSYVTVVGNCCVENLHGIALNSAQNCIVLNNICSFNGSGIKVWKLAEWNAPDVLSIVSNRCSDNVNDAISIDGAGVNNEIARNLGFNPQGPEPISVGSSPFTYVNTDNVPEVVYIDGGAVSQIAKASTTLFTSTGKAVPMNPGETLSVTFSQTPTIVRDRR